MSDPVGKERGKPGEHYAIKRRAGQGNFKQADEINNAKYSRDVKK